jgi:DNA mismatch endonuclease (patch repair protein)
MVDNLTEIQRRKNMQAIRSTNTKMEQFIAKELWNRGYRFRKNVKNLTGKPDIAIKKYKVAIFLDSCFWHGCELHCIYPKSNTEYWAEKILKNIQHDRKINDYYSNKGWHLLRIWEHEVKSDRFQVIEKIARFIDEAKNQ